MLIHTIRQRKEVLIAMGAENGIPIIAGIGFLWKGINKWKTEAGREIHSLLMIGCKT